jgi:hypothetical protein
MDVAKKVIKFAENQRVINEKLNGELLDPYDTGYDIGYDNGYDTGYANGVASVSNPLEYAKSLSYSGVSFPDGYELTINAPCVESFNDFMKFTPGIKKITIKGVHNSAASFSNAFQYSSVEILDVSDFNFAPSNLSGAFTGASLLREINGVIDFSNFTWNDGWYVFEKCSSLIEMRVAKDSIRLRFDIKDSPLLSSETIQSIADGLMDRSGMSNGVIKVHSDIIAKATDEQKITIISKNWSVQ